MSTLIAMYDNLDTARRAMEELHHFGGFSAGQLSLIANDHEDKFGSLSKSDVKSDEGASFGAVVGALTGLGIALIPGVGQVIAGGALASAIIGAGLGAAAGAATGGLVAGLIDLGVPADEAEFYAEGLRRGGNLVVLHLDEGDEQLQNAKGIMYRYNPLDVTRMMEDYRREGWTGYDPGATQLSNEQVSVERQRFKSYANYLDEHYDPVGEISAEPHIDGAEAETTEGEISTRNIFPSPGGVGVRHFILPDRSSRSRPK